MNKKTPKTKGPTLVHCKNCHNRYYREKDELGKKEQCGVCLKDSVLVIGEPK